MATTTNIVSWLLFIFLVVSIPGLQAQQKDFNTWHEFGVEKSLSKRLDLSGEIETRFRENSTSLDRILFTLAASYDLTGYLRAAAGYRLVYANGRETGLDLRRRLHSDLTGRYSLGEVDFSLRVRFQYGYEETGRAFEFGDNSFVNRNRIKAGYHIFGTKIGIFASAETWGLINNNPGRMVRHIRYSAGASYALNFRSEFTLRYILEDEINQTDPWQSHILLLGYAHSL